MIELIEKLLQHLERQGDVECLAVAGRLGEIRAAEGEVAATEWVFGALAYRLDNENLFARHRAEQSGERTG